jgi:hypothetical protein
LNILLQSFNQVAQFREQSGIFFQIIGEWDRRLRLRRLLGSTRRYQKQCCSRAIDQETPLPPCCLSHPVTSAQEFLITLGELAFSDWRPTATFFRQTLPLHEGNGQKIVLPTKVLHSLTSEQFC